MTHALKKWMVFLLTLSLIFACLTPGVGAADGDGESDAVEVKAETADETAPITAVEGAEDIGRAVVATAMAYYYKGALAQYDNQQLTPQDRTNGDRRSTSGEAPEWASDEHTLFLTGADLAYSTLLHTIGYKLTGGSRTVLTSNLSYKVDPSADGIIFHTGGKDKTLDGDAVRASVDLLQPGDVICYCTGSGNDGRAGVYVGDVKGDGGRYYISVEGKKLNMTTGVDAIESLSYSLGGAVRLVSVISQAAGYNMADPGTTLASFTIYRPSVIAEKNGLSLTDEAKARLAYPGIEVDRSASVKQYDTVQNGDEITVTVTVTNHGKDEFKDVAVSEPLPTGAEVVASSVKGGSVSGGAVTGSLNVPAGGSATLEYTVKVTGKRGEDVSFPSGAVGGGLTTRPRTVRIGGKAWNEANADILGSMLAVKNTRKLKNLSYSGDLGFANAFYKEFLGLDLGLPNTVQELRDQVLAWSDEAIPSVSDSTFDGKMLRPIPESKLTEQGKHIRQMILPEHLAGYWVLLRDDPKNVPAELSAPGRVLLLQAKNYQPGDIFVGYNHKNTAAPDVYQPEVYLYLGYDMAAGFKSGENEIVVEPFEDNLGKFLRHHVFFVLRPTLAFDDANDGESAPKFVSFPDVKSTDWFYGYVMDLAKEGIVGGMSDGTFQPAGTLTYGQALKLLICALDKDVGNASSGHWASGYLSAAQSKGWISGSVNLDAGVSRLAFCQIAAKAKGLTEQPASNPFTDTSDPAVLALNKAGVIGGMGEGKFSPDTTLTRAQISKIIVELRKA